MSAAAPRYRLDAAGWSAGAWRYPSPHHDPRPDGEDPWLVVLHCVSLPPGRFGTGCPAALFTGCLDTGRDPVLADLAGLRVSSHYLIDRQGRLLQFVSRGRRAWHAGVSSFEGRSNCNDFSLGIELEGTDRLPYEEGQYRVLIELLAALAQAGPIRAVVGHSDIAPGRKTDPGPGFDWARLWRRRQTFGAPAFPGVAARAQIRGERRA